MIKVKTRMLGAVLLGALALAMPATASAHGPCGRDFAANDACRIASPASLRGSLTTSKERDYYVFSAVKGTKLRITITAGACVGVTVACGDVNATLYRSQHHKIGATGTAKFDLQRSKSYSYRVGTAGTYYIIVTGHTGTATPPVPSQGPGGQPRLVPSAYTLGVKASPNVHQPPTPPTAASCAAHTGKTLLEDGELRVFTSMSDTYACARPSGTPTSLTDPADPTEAVTRIQLAGAYVAWEQDSAGTQDLHVMDPQSGTGRTVAAGMEVPNRPVLEQYVVNQDGVLVWLTSAYVTLPGAYSEVVEEDAGHGTSTLDSVISTSPSAISSLGLSSSGDVAYWVDNGQYRGASIG